MNRTNLLEDIKRMRFEEAYDGYRNKRLSQSEAALLLGVCDRTFRRYMCRYDIVPPNNQTVFARRAP